MIAEPLTHNSHTRAATTAIDLRSLMSSVIATPSRSTHRAQIVAEAVVSAYIHEIAPPQHRRERRRLAA
jgi:hypothetical protein